MTCQAKELRKLVRRVRVLVRRVETAFEHKQIYPRNITSDQMLSAMFRRTVGTVRSVVLLAESGHGADALALTRNLVDSFIVGRWVTNQDAETRGRLFWGFEAKQLERQREIIQKYSSGADIPPLPGGHTTEQIAAEYKRWDTWGPGVRTMAIEDEVLNPEAWLNMQPIWSHEVLFFLASCYLHPTPLGVREWCTPKGGVFNFDKRDEGNCAEQALVACASLIAHLANRISVFWGLGLSDELAGYWQKYIDPWLQSQQ